MGGTARRGAYKLVHLAHQPPVGHDLREVVGLPRPARAVLRLLHPRVHDRAVHQQQPSAEPLTRLPRSIHAAAHAPACHAASAVARRPHAGQCTFGHGRRKGMARDLAQHAGRRWAAHEPLRCATLARATRLLACTITSAAQAEGLQSSPAVHFGCIRRRWWAVTFRVTSSSSLARKMTGADDWLAFSCDRRADGDARNETAPATAAGGGVARDAPSTRRSQSASPRRRHPARGRSPCDSTPSAPATGPDGPCAAVVERWPDRSVPSAVSSRWAAGLPCSVFS
jgi:hypothetical protein